MPPEGQGYDARVSALRGLAARLWVASHSVETAGTSATHQAQHAAGACGGGPLQSSLADFADTMNSRSMLMNDVIGNAGWALDAVAATYENDDRRAAGLITPVPIPGFS